MFRKPFKITIGAVLAGAALTACGPLKPGAAAIVGNDRITVAKLNATVDEWSKELPKYPDAQQIAQQAQSQGDQVPYDPSSPQRSALYQIIDMKVWDKVARGDGVNVSSGQVDALIAQNGGRARLDSYVIAQGLPTSYGRDYARVTLLQAALHQRYGISNAADQQTQLKGLQQLYGSYQRAARQLKVDVNPRYGSLRFTKVAADVNIKRMTLWPICPALSKPDSGTPSASGGNSCQA